MSEITIEVVEDTDHPQGGHAVIRLNGLWLLPANATYRIDPVDDTDEGELPADWPQGDRTPMSTRLTPQGVEIVVGPDVVDAPSMLPGTPVAVSVPAAFVRAEVLWPDLPVSTPPPAPPVVLTAAELAAELDAVALASRQRQEAEALLQLRQHMNGTAASASHRDGDSKDLAQLKLRNGYDADVPAPPAELPRVAPVLDGEPVSRPHELPMATLVMPPVQSGTALLAEPPTRQRAIVPWGAPAAGASSTRRTLSVGAPFALGFAIAAALTALVALRQGGSASPPVIGDALSQPASFSDMLALALVSPRGRSAADVDLPTALKLADESLHPAAGGGDQVEASFWLRKAIALSVGTPQLTWTLTQLGTLYARPSAGAPDYGKARLLWEMAGASGDASALCFLGALYEHGLGVAKSGREALGYYQRAKSQGGCRGVEEAIARVRN